MPASVRPGDVIAGKYRVERVIGEGGMGVVVAARHLVLGERAAIKLLGAERDQSPQAKARFLREGRAAAKIKSEHVARVYDVGELATGEPFIVMEYLHGRDVGAMVRQDGPLDAPRAVDLVLEAMEGIAAAHARGVIHRDIKPSNLFMTKGPDGGPLVKVIDFGISKDTAPRGEASGEAATRSDVAMGSPPYMSPEQMRSSRDVDARTDVWSLGAVLTCLITGEPPFAGGSIPEVYEGILKGPPSLRDWSPDVPEGLDRVIGRCLARDVDERYPDVTALARDLAPFGGPLAPARAERIAKIASAPADATLDEEGGGEVLATSVGDAELGTATSGGREPSWGDAAPIAPSRTRDARDTQAAPGASMPAPSANASPPSRAWAAWVVTGAAVLVALVMAFRRGAPEPQPLSSARTAASAVEDKPSPSIVVSASAAAPPLLASSPSASAPLAPPASAVAASAAAVTSAARPPAASKGISAPKAGAPAPGPSPGPKTPPSKPVDPLADPN